MDAILEMFSQVRDAVIPYRFVITSTVAVSIFVFGGLSWYKYNRNNFNEDAHSALQTLQQLMDIEVATAEEKDVEGKFASVGAKWKRVRDVAHNAYVDYSGAGIASFFKVYEADALLGLGQEKEARELLDSAIGKMSEGDLHDLFSAKLALMKMDLSDKENVKSGLAELKTLASRKDSTVREMALYRLGEYFWIMKAFEESKNYWGQIVFQHERSGHDSLGIKQPPEWVTKAQEKLQLMVSK
ncbi:tetratricopeptide repeat protein [Candidatus Babeliales bacterium]|nr:tetratricopeptide repeat protein [Candidatus Babeliales bacterium]